MPEIRRDFLLDRWVVIAPERARRPMPAMPPVETDDRDICPFCPGREGQTPPEVSAMGRAGSPPDTPGWSVRVVPNLFPGLVPHPAPPAPPTGGPGVPGYGRHEVVVESPDHRARWHTLTSEQRARVLGAAVDRMTFLASEPGIRSVFLFRNEGRAAGATLSHPHLQLLALPVEVPLIAAEEAAARARHAELGACPWCRWLEDELRSETRVVEAGPRVVVLCPGAPRVPYEIWVVPRPHAAGFTECEAGLRLAAGDAVAGAVARLTSCLGEVATNWFLHSLGPGDSAPHYHWHVEILPRTVHTAGFEWGSGMYLHPVMPEAAAAALRAAGPGADRF